MKSGVISLNKNVWVKIARLRTFDLPKMWDKTHLYSMKILPLSRYSVRVLTLNWSEIRCCVASCSSSSAQLSICYVCGDLAGRCGAEKRFVLLGVREAAGRWESCPLDVSCIQTTPKSAFYTEGGDKQHHDQLVWAWRGSKITHRTFNHST